MTHCLVNRVQLCWVGHSGGTPNTRAPGLLGSGTTSTTSILLAVEHVFEITSSELWMLSSASNTRGSSLQSSKNILVTYFCFIFHEGAFSFQSSHSNVSSVFELLMKILRIQNYYS